MSYIDKGSERAVSFWKNATDVMEALGIVQRRFWDSLPQRGYVPISEALWVWVRANYVPYQRTFAIPGEIWEG